MSDLTPEDRERIFQEELARRKQRPKRAARRRTSRDVSAEPREPDPAVVQVVRLVGIALLVAAAVLAAGSISVSNFLGRSADCGSVFDKWSAGGDFLPEACDGPLSSRESLVAVLGVVGGLVLVAGPVASRGRPSPPSASG